MNADEKYLCYMNVQLAFKNCIKDRVLHVCNQCLFFLHQAFQPIKNTCINVSYWKEFLEIKRRGVNETCMGNAKVRIWPK